MKQSRKQSFIESLINTSVGFLISLVSINVILPIMGIESNGSKNIIITLYFTAISIARSYLIRRFFNRK